MSDFGGKKRSELPDNVFGIPQERKYPMPDEKHTRSAIKLFNHVEPKYEEQLAKAIIKNMKKYNIDGSVVGPNNRLRKYLPKDMIKESMLLEGLLKSDKDIYYNKDKFDSGEINLCFITGLSGSGKSTMGRGMTSKNIEHYEMDDIICNDNFSDSNLKEYGGLIESFFKGPGKSFRLIRDNDTHNNSVFKSHKNYEKEITQAFVKHALSYCKSHMNTKFICDGIWVFMFINPSQLKDCAVYIKGTSSIKSGYRALKRDIDEDKRNGMTSLQIFKHEFKRVKEDILYAKENQKELKSFRSYFEKQSTNESVSSTVSKDHKQKGHIEKSSSRKITTVVFDLGDVLIKSNMQNKLKKNPRIPNQQIYPLLEKWFDDDLDLLSKDEYIDIISKRLSPDFSDIVPDIVDAFSDIEVLPYTIPTLKDLREKGYRIYYLSNWSRWGVEILGEKNKLEFLSLFDGGLFSYEVGVKKPDRKIYDTFIKKFKINPKEAIFVDNKKKNIEAAKKFGLQGIVFDKLDISLVYDVLEESSISEYGTTGGTIVGSNQPDSVYIVNYMQNNAFSGHKEPKFGVCRKGMKDLHIVGGKYNRFHYVSDLDKFKEEASDIHVYRYKGKPKNEFFDIIEEMKDDNDLDLYKLITGREIKDRSEIRFDGDFIEEECFFDTIDAIKACTEAGLLEASTDLHPVPILTETVQGRPYNYYRDLNGVFIQHEITGLRSKSYETLDDIPDAEKDIVKRGYLV